MKIVFSSRIKLLIVILFIVSLVLGSHYRSRIKNVMKKILPVTVLKQPKSDKGINILFLHHSTGKAIWNGGVSKYFINYNKEYNKSYQIIEQEFPKSGGNYPYDYWNIWVNHHGKQPYKKDPTLELITEKYDVIIWKHCYPVGDIKEDLNKPDIGSNIKMIETYKLQYEALKKKMLEFPTNKFLVWTGAQRVRNTTNEEEAKRSKYFFDWVRNEWDEPGDNIFIWDFYKLETEGGLYFKDEYAKDSANSHPNESFSQRVSQYFCQRIIDVIEGRGDSSQLTGEY